MRNNREPVPVLTFDTRKRRSRGTEVWFMADPTMASRYHSWAWAESMRLGGWGVGDDVCSGEALVSCLGSNKGVKGGQNGAGVSKICISFRFDCDNSFCT